MISLMFGLVIGAMALILQLALWIMQAFFVVGLELCMIAVEFIINTIGACFGATGTSISSRKATEIKPVAKYVPARDTHRRISKRERREIEKKVRREFKKDQDDLEYDMLMMMEVCADD